MDQKRDNNPTILVVDDSEENRAFLIFWLEEHGFRVLEAANGNEAIEIAERQYPSLILMEINMPQRSGISAAYRIRKISKLKDVPIIAITAYSSPQIHQEALKAGCLAVLTKPIEVSKLEQLLNESLPHVPKQAAPDEPLSRLERRFYPRFHLDTALLFDERGRTVTAQIENISLSGLYMRTQTGLPEGVILNLRIPLGEDDLIVVPAEVVRHTPRHGVGMRFHWPPESDRNRRALEREISNH